MGFQIPPQKCPCLHLKGDSKFERKYKSFAVFMCSGAACASICLCVVLLYMCVSAKLVIKLVENNRKDFQLLPAGQILGTLAELALRYESIFG